MRHMLIIMHQDQVCLKKPMKFVFAMSSLNGRWNIKGR